MADLATDILFGSGVPTIRATQGVLYFDTSAGYKGYVRTGGFSTGAWNAFTPAAVAPGGADTDVQFNDAGAFGGSASFTFDKTSGHAGVGTNATANIINAPSDFADFYVPTFVVQDARTVFGSHICQIAEATTYENTTVNGAHVYGILLCGQIVPTSTHTLDEYIGIFCGEVNYGSGAIGHFWGGTFAPQNYDGAVVDFTGLVIEPSNSSAAGAIDAFAGLRIHMHNTGNAAVTNYRGVYIETPQDNNNQVVNNYGLFIENHSVVGSALAYNIFSDGVGKNHFTGGVEVATQAAMIASSVDFTNGAAAAAGTLLNAPAAGNPTKWIGINDNGTTRYVPAW